MEDISSDIRTSIICSSSGFHIANMVSHDDLEKQFQRQGMGQHRQFRGRDNLTSAVDGNMHRIDIQSSSMGDRIGKQRLILFLLYVFRRFQRVHQKMGIRYKMVFQQETL